MKDNRQIIIIIVIIIIVQGRPDLFMLKVGGICLCPGCYAHSDKLAHSFVSEPDSVMELLITGSTIWSHTFMEVRTGDYDVYYTIFSRMMILLL